MADLLGAFEQAVMLSVVRLGEEAYGRSILRAAGESLQRSVSAGAIYATLDRLESKGLLSSALGPGTPARDGRPRRFYRLTAPGVKSLNEAKAGFEQIWKGTKWPLKSPA